MQAQCITILVALILTLCKAALINKLQTSVVRPMNYWTETDTVLTEGTHLIEVF